MDSSASTIVGWIEPESILLDVEVRDRHHALQVMAESIARIHGLDAEPVLRALERRECAASTALGQGFAIPHARIVGLEQPLTLFMRTRQGIAFDAPDGKPVSDFLTILVPNDGDKEAHLRLLALIVELFADRAFRVALDEAPSAAAVAALFRAGTLRVGSR